MSNNYAYIIGLCNQIAKAGKTPSVALLRNKSNRPLAIPEIIQTLKSWKEDPAQQVEEESLPNKQEVELSLEQRVEKLEAQVLTLQQLLHAKEK